MDVDAEFKRIQRRVIELVRQPTLPKAELLRELDAWRDTLTRLQAEPLSEHRVRDVAQALRHLDTVRHKNPLHALVLQEELAAALSQLR